jgi:Mg2+ and Co2+ transporter CorA
VQRAEEANNILAATSKLAAESAEQTKQGVKQAEESSKQNRSLMIFTIVTIIFVSDESLKRKRELLLISGPSSL